MATQLDGTRISVGEKTAQLLRGEPGRTTKCRFLLFVDQEPVHLALERIAEVELARILVKDLAIVVDEQARRVRAGLEQQEQGRAVRRRRTSPERIRCPRDQRSALLPLADALVALVAFVVFVALVAFVSI